LCFVDCVIYVEGSVAKVTSQYVGIYVSREFQPKIEHLRGRGVRVLVIIDDCEKSSTH